MVNIYEEFFEKIFLALNLIRDPYNPNTRFLRNGSIIFNEHIMNLMGHSCRVDKHIETFPELFYEAMARLWKVLKLFYENDKVKIEAKNLEITFHTFHWLKI